MSPSQFSLGVFGLRFETEGGKEADGGREPGVPKSKIFLQQKIEKFPSDVYKAGCKSATASKGTAIANLILDAMSATAFANLLQQGLI